MCADHIHRTAMGYLKSGIFFFILISCLFSEQQFTFADEITPKIVIVGAGAAGIAAASSLVDNGFTDVTILEMKSRIGGRIHTMEFGDEYIDMGAEWVYGDKGNIVYNLASKHNLLEDDTEGTEDNRKFLYIRSNSEVLSTTVWKHLQNITDELEEFLDKELINVKGSYGIYKRKKFNEMLERPENNEIDKKIAKEYYEAFAKDSSRVELTQSIDDISAHDWANYESNGDVDSRRFKGNGYIELLYILMDTNKTDNEFGKLAGKIELSKPVIEIQWQHSDHKALLKTQEGTEYVADHVIVTVPLGVLKTHSKDLFDPNLPDTKQKVIEALGFGLVNKIVLELKMAFWQPDWYGSYFLWRVEDLKEIRGTKREWISDAFVAFPVYLERNLLAIWIAGDGARIMEDLEEDQLIADCLYLLNKFIPSGEKEKREIVNIISTSWATDPSFYGAGSYHSLETEKANVNNDQLAEPIKEGNKPVLLFAGEATDGLYGTVHGAVRSGQREAKRLKDYYMNGK